MSSNEILWIAVVSVLLLSGVMFRIALHYRDQVKALKEQVQDIKKKMKENEFRYLKESKQTIDECDADLEERDKEIKQLKQEIEERDEEIKQLKQKIEERDEEIKQLKQEIKERDEKIQRLTQELKPRDEAVKAPLHKNKKSKKKGK
ncbi:coiled-coil domain-containing protein [Bartonella sp. CE47NXGY]|uniref:coiled-coil domain-containing protein n=1 Tax=Bartonella sp. CE47NXGY TaxID=3243514 RepID=UPI0035CFDD46